MKSAKEHFDEQIAIFNERVAKLMAARDVMAHIHPHELHWGHVGTIQQVNHDLLTVLDFLNIK